MPIKKILFSAALIIAVTGLKAQTLLTENEAIAKALNNSRNASAALLDIQQQQQLLKSSVNLPNPQLTWQSPTGSFYTGGVTQSFEFPTVYVKQYQLQKQQVRLAQTQKTFTDIQIGYQVRSLYLDIQYTDSLKNQLYIQDTIYSKIAQSAKRQFDAGQIDYLQKTFAETQYGEVNNQYEQAKLSFAALINQLKFITAIRYNIVIQPLLINSNFYEKDSALISQNSEFLIAKQMENIGLKNLELQRNKALPGLVFGYLNPADRDASINKRFQFGLSIPLWFWQYKGNINAARTQLSAAQERTSGLQQQVAIQIFQSQKELAVNKQALMYYQNTGLRKSNEIITTSKRFLTSGETDYISYLRNINDAYLIKQKYLESLRKVNQSIITINYLTGKL